MQPVRGCPPGSSDPTLAALVRRLPAFPALRAVSSCDASVPLLVALSASLLALTLAACGGGGGSTSLTSEVNTPQPQTTSAGAAGRPGHTIGPLRVSGGGSAQFEVSGGDNSIQDYGSEAGQSELRRAAEAVHSFYVARVGEEWASACSYLAKSTAAGLGQLAASSPQVRGKGCLVVLRALTKPPTPSLQRQITTLDAAALRRQGEKAFLIYLAPPGRTVYAMPLTLEGGEWKLGGIAGAELQGA